MKQLLPCLSVSRSALSSNNNAKGILQSLKSNVRTFTSGSLPQRKSEPTLVIDKNDSRKIVNCFSGKVGNLKRSATQDSCAARRWVRIFVDSRLEGSVSKIGVLLVRQLSKMRENNLGGSRGGSCSWIGVFGVSRRRYLMARQVLDVLRGWVESCCRRSECDEQINRSLGEADATANLCI